MLAILCGVLYHLLLIGPRIKIPLDNRRRPNVKQKGTAHQALGLGRANRKQRLCKYVEEREAVLAGGKCKRLRRVMMCPIDANADLEPDAEVARGTCVYSEECLGAEVCAAQLTLVSAGGESGYVVCAVCVGGTLLRCVVRRFVYYPDILRDVLFAREAAPVDVNAPPIHERQHAEGEREAVAGASMVWQAEGPRAHNVEAGFALMAVPKAYVRATQLEIVAHHHGHWPA